MKKNKIVNMQQNSANLQCFYKQTLIINKKFAFIKIK